MRKTASISSAPHTSPHPPHRCRQGMHTHRKDIHTVSNLHQSTILTAHVHALSRCLSKDTFLQGKVIGQAAVVFDAPVSQATFRKLTLFQIQHACVWLGGTVLLHVFPAHMFCYTHRTSYMADSQVKGADFQWTKGR